MRISLFLLPLAASAFSPRLPVAIQKVSPLKSVAIGEVGDTVIEKTETLLEKADDLVIKRAMRLVNHVPIVYTLNELVKSLGSAKWGLDIAPSALGITAPAGLAVPVWVGYTLRLIAVAQVASVAKSVLADSDELSQTSISATAVTNVALGRALTDGSLVNWAVAAVLSGYTARNGADAGDMNVHNAAVQLTSSVATIATLLGTVAALPSIVPFLGGQPELNAGIALVGYYFLANREGNSTTKRVVTAGVAAGILWAKIAAGALAPNMKNLLQIGTLVTAGTAGVAYVALTKAKDALS